MQNETLRILSDIIGEMEQRQNHLDDLAAQYEEDGCAENCNIAEHRAMELDRWINALRDMVEAA